MERLILSLRNAARTRIQRLVIAMLALNVGCLSPSVDAEARRMGPLVIVGGGGTPPEVVARAVELAGGASARVVILPQASSLATTGEESAGMFRAAGASEVSVLEIDNEAAPHGPTIDCATDEVMRLSKATMIWFPGGDQNRLMRRLEKAGLVNVIRRRSQEGCVMGGTSAGAAVMSALMMTGDADLDAIRAGRTTLAPGLGLWPGVIVDQHFHKRRRFNRLLAAVLDHPDLVGVGIDEKTAVIVQSDRIEVLGASSALLIDARGANVSSVEGGRPANATGVRIDVVPSGASFRMRH